MNLMAQETNIKKRILLVEDDKFISMAYKDSLTRAGFEIITAADGNEALKKIEEGKFDLILLDVIMPGKNGFEVLIEIKKNETLKNIPVIITSNLGQETDIKRGKDLGATDYLIKANLSVKEVVNKINGYLNISRLL